MRTIKILIIILIVIQVVNIYQGEFTNRSYDLSQNTYNVVDPTILKDVKTVEYVLVGAKQGWSNHIQEASFSKPVMIIGANLIACVSSTQGIEALLSTGAYDFSRDTYSDDTLFHLSAIYSQTGGLATATVMFPREFYYYVEAGEKLNIDLFANTPGDGGSFLIYYVEFNEDIK